MRPGYRPGMPIGGVAAAVVGAVLLALGAQFQGRGVRSVDGVEGLEAIRATRPDLVVLDWMMPRMNGLDVCAQVRADPAIATTRILMLTAKAQEADLERAYTSGADEYAQKPFSPRELAARVDALLAR